MTLVIWKAGLQRGKINCAKEARITQVISAFHGQNGV